MSSTSNRYALARETLHSHSLMQQMQPGPNVTRKKQRILAIIAVIFKMHTRKSKADETVERFCPIFRKAPRLFIKLLQTGALRQRGRVVRVPGLKSRDPEFKSRSDH